MKLSEIFSQLTHGEFSQLSIGGAGAGKIQEENMEAVVAHINLGLTDLFVRFPLKEGRVTLRPQPNQLVYPLLEKYALSNTKSKELTRYLIDTPQTPYREDTLIKVERVLDLDEEEVLLNVEGDPESCFTYSMDEIRIPKEAKDDLILVYRENHPLITIPVGYFDPTRVNVQLPRTHLQALLYFVASRAHNPVGLQGDFHKGNSYWAKYEAACAALELKNVEPDRTYEKTRFERGGWC